MESPDWSRPVRPNDSAARYSPADDPAYQGFHTYATSDLYDTNGGQERWPDNWSGEAPEDDEDYDDEDEGAASKRDYWTALLWTVGWFAIPVLILVVQALVQPGNPDAACTEGGLGDCSSPRTLALGELIENSPIWLAALVAALALTTVVRWASDTWRGATIGFCAAVVAGGAITILYQIW